MKVIVAGGRDFTDIVTMQAEVLALARSGRISDSSELVCGMAQGADITGYRLWTEFFKLPVHKRPAEWDRLGNRAGFVRNDSMAQEADVLIAFWDGKSKGTAHMIQTMRRMRKPVFVYNY